MSVRFDVPEAIRNLEEMLIKLKGMKTRDDLLSALTKMCDVSEAAAAALGSEKPEMYHVLAMLLGLAWEMEQRFTEIEETIEGLRRMMKSFSPSPPGGRY